MKINDEISLSQNIWEAIRKKIKEINEKISSNDIEGTLIAIKKQGSVATRTIINPLISRGKNEVDVDIALIIKQTSINDKNKLFESITKILKNLYPDNEWKLKSKAISTDFEIKNDLETIYLGLDIVILSEDEKGKTRVWNSDINDWEYSDPFSLIDLFNDERKKDSKLLENNKIIKALRDLKGVKGLKSIFILNASLRAKDYELHSILNSLDNELELLNKNGYVTSKTNDMDKITKPNDFNFITAKRLIGEIRAMSDNDLNDLIENKLNPNNKSKFKPSKLMGPLVGSVHHHDKK